MSDLDFLTLNNAKTKKNPKNVDTLNFYIIKFWDNITLILTNVTRDIFFILRLKKLTCELHIILPLVFQNLLLYISVYIDAPRLLTVAYYFVTK